MTLPKRSEAPPADAVGRYRDNHGRSMGPAPIAAANRGYLDTDFPDSVACPYLPKQRQLGGGKRTHSAVFHSSFAGRIAREGDRLIEPPPSRGLVATKTHGGPSRGAHVAAPVSRLNHSFQQHSVNAVQSYLAKLPHLFVAFRGGCFDAVHSTRRLVANDQFIVGEIRNV